MKDEDVMSSTHKPTWTKVISSKQDLESLVKKGYKPNFPIRLNFKH